MNKRLRKLKSDSQRSTLSELLMAVVKTSTDLTNFAKTRASAKNYVGKSFRHFFRYSLSVEAVVDVCSLIDCEYVLNISIF